MVQPTSALLPNHRRGRELDVPIPGSITCSCQSEEIAAASEGLDSTGSRNGLNSRSSSVTYPAVVPSENVTMNPSSPSRSTFSIRIGSPIGRVYTVARLLNCLVLLTLRLAPQDSSEKFRQLDCVAGLFSRTLPRIVKRSMGFEGFYRLPVRLFDGSGCRRHCSTPVAGPASTSIEKLCRHRDHSLHWHLALYGLSHELR
jgi:hypothetical protein